MADNETRVVYRAIADFAAVTRAARNARREIRQLREEEAALNAQSAAGSAAASRASRQATSDRSAATSAADDHNAAVQRGTRSVLQQASANRTNATSHRAAATAATSARRATDALGSSYHDAAQGAERLGRSARSASRGLDGNRKRGNLLTRTFRGMLPYVERINNGFDKLGKWRPRLTPPFIALIPAIAGLLALMNPLVAGLGAIGGAAIGFASSLGRVAGAALGTIPAIFSLISAVAALKVAFGGFGTALSAFKAAKNADLNAGISGGSTAATEVKLAELTLQEKMIRAQEAYRRSVEDVRWAQEDLTDAKKDYVRRLAEVQRAVDNAGLSEARAAANVQLAYEEYKRTLADPNASQGDRMAAEVAYKEALEAEGEVQEENKKNAEDLADMKKKGMKGDRQVITAQRALTDAINRQRDAQLEVINVQRRAQQEAQQAAQAAATTPAAKAWDQYEQALSQLSPSARSVVEQLIGMYDAWKDLQKVVQERFFSHIVDDIGRLRGMLPAVESLLGNTADALGRVAENFLLLFTSQDWKDDFVLLGEGNVPIIENVGNGLLALMDMFRNLTVIVQPFFTALTEGFLKGSENLANIVEAARESGSLGKWLMGDGESRGVLDTLRQWWRIIKNIGKTIYNYSSAAREFSEWLMDGFEATTEGWLQSSEDATKKDSPFKVWLENIKPVLSGLSDLFGTFFRWFAEESGNTQNIDHITEILRQITEELGPALATVFDNLSKADVGPKFVDALVKIVEIIATLVDSGAVSTFFDFLNGMLDIIQQLLEIPGVAELLGVVLSVFGAIAAMSFVAKFTGLENFIGWLLKLANGGKTLPGLLGSIAGKLKLFPSKTPVVAPGTVTGGVSAAGIPTAATVAQTGARRAATSAGQASYAPSYGTTPTPRRAVAKQSLWSRLTGTGSKSVAAEAGKATQTGGKLATAGRALSKGGSILGKGLRVVGGPIGVVASIAGGMIGDAVANGAEAGSGGSTQRVLGNTLSGAATGAGIGGAIGSIIPVVGTAAGAAVGGVAGGAIGMLGSSSEDKEQFFSDIANGWNSFWGETLPGWWEDLSSGFDGWISDLGAGWDNFWAETWPAFWEDLGVKWDTFWSETFPKFVGFAVGATEQWIANIGTSWDTFWNETLPQWIEGIGQNWDTFWNETIPQWVESIGQGWTTFWEETLPQWIENIGQEWTTFWEETVPQWVDSVAEGWDTFWNETLPGWGEDLAESAGNIVDGVGDAWNNFWEETLPNFGEKLREAGSNFFGGLTSGFNSWWEEAKANFNIGRSAGREAATPRHNGGIIRRAAGGTVPGSGNSDTVDAKLTPGEFVIRKAVVGRVGEDNLAKLNAGIMTYADLLRAAEQRRPGTQQKSSGSGSTQFFSGGGLVPSLDSVSAPKMFGGSGSTTPFAPAGQQAQVSQGPHIVIEKFEVNNPKGEPTEKSLHAAVRKIDYVYGGAE